MACKSATWTVQKSSTWAASEAKPRLGILAMRSKSFWTIGDDSSNTLIPLLGSLQEPSLIKVELVGPADIGCNLSYSIKACVAIGVSPYPCRRPERRGPGIDLSKRSVQDMFHLRGAYMRMIPD